MSDIEFSTDPRENAEKRVCYKQFLLYYYLSQYSKGEKKEKFWTKAKRFGLKIGAKFAERIPVFGAAAGAALDAASESVEEKNFTDKNINEIAKKNNLMSLKEFDKRAKEKSGKGYNKELIKDVEENRHDINEVAMRDDIEQLRGEYKKMQKELEKQKERLKKQDQDLQIIKKYLEAQKEAEKDNNKRENLNLGNSPLSEISANKEKLVQTSNANHDLTKRMQENRSQATVSISAF